MSSYSSAEKIFHRVYLSNYFISKASLEMDSIMYGAQAKKNHVEECVFITGLARSGTTALMRKLFQTGEYASLQYSNMPILLSPNLWNKSSDIEKHERAHKDGIMIDGNSPEEFDEYFWKVFLNDSYIRDGLYPHEVDAQVMEKYEQYIALICHSKQKKKYISKNNNNILRLSSLKKIKGIKIIILFREPMAHAASLMKLHLSFVKNQKEDPFVLDYFNYLGHHEFGLGHKPFILTEAFLQQRKGYAMDSLDYWVSVWINYYEYLLDHLDPGYLLFSFEDLINDPGKVYRRLKEELAITAPLETDKKHRPGTYPEVHSNKELQAKARSIYKKLESLKDH